MTKEANVTRHEIIVVGSDPRQYLGYVEGSEYDIHHRASNRDGWLVLEDAWELVLMRQPVGNGREILGENRSYMLMPIGPFFSSVPKFRIQPTVWYLTESVEGCAEQIKALRAQMEKAEVANRARASGISTTEDGIRGPVTGPLGIGLADAMRRTGGGMHRKP